MNPDLKYAIAVCALFAAILGFAGLGVLLGFGHDEENGPCSGDGDTGRSVTSGE